LDALSPESLVQDQLVASQNPHMHSFEASETALTIDGSSRAPASAAASGVSLSPAPSLAMLQAGAARSNRSWLKRLVDVTGAAAGLIFLAPVLLLVAIAIRFESQGPIFFRQRRTGRAGVVFHIYKFRTMTVTEDGPNIVQAAQNDPRITRIGGFLRRSSIDELPQLLNVIRGDMSLVGPRPHAVGHDEYYGQRVEGYGNRFLVRPGIAGLAQVSGHRGATATVEAMAARVRLDQAYIAEWSFLGDLGILVRAVTEGPFHPAAF
jgi:putative colanic acid biosynthesis UDP-glucose lipid carrier transferase